MTGPTDGAPEDTAASAHFANAYGLTWAADLPMAQFSAATPVAAPDVTLRRVAAVPERTPLHNVHKGHVFADGFRLPWQDQVIFDLVHDDAAQHSQISYCPGPGWRGQFPHALFGTVTGLALAWRGAIPFHACAVAIAGRGVLICGLSGAGKSTLTAGLVAEGAQLLSDDLTVITGAAGALIIQPGRPAIRMFPDMAHWMPTATLGDAGDGARGKLLVRPDDALADAAVPLSAFVLIGDQVVPEPTVMRVALLRRQLFRPEWLAHVPGQPARISRLSKMAVQVPILTLPRTPMLDEPGWRARAKAATDLVLQAGSGTMNQPV